MRVLRLRTAPILLHIHPCKLPPYYARSSQHDDPQSLHAPHCPSFFPSSSGSCHHCRRRRSAGRSSSSPSAHAPRRWPQWHRCVDRGFTSHHATTEVVGGVPSRPRRTDAQSVREREVSEGISTQKANPKHQHTPHTTPHTTQKRRLGSIKRPSIAQTPEPSKQGTWHARTTPFFPSPTLLPTRPSPPVKAPAIA